MLKFSHEVRRVYPGRRRHIFREIEDSYLEARKQRRAQLNPEDVSLVAKIPFKTFVLLQVGLRRALELTESAVREINAHSLLSSFVTSRALFETACVMFYTWEKVEAALTSHQVISLDELDDDVMQLLMGGRDKDWGGSLQAKNILTVIDHVAKVFKQARKHYAALSEFAHPNYSGMLDIYQRSDNRTQRTVFIYSWKENHGRLPLLIGGVLESLTIINFALEHFTNRLPDFVRLCEEGIFRSGAWPKTITYRWNQ